MPKFELSDAQVTELVDLLYGEIQFITDTSDEQGDADAIQARHRRGVYLEILEVLEDA